MSAAVVERGADEDATVLAGNKALITKLHEVLGR